MNPMPPISAWRVWLRELLGLLFILLGLFVWGNCLNMLYDQALIEGIVLFFIGLVVFKAGMHLFKVALAVRVLLHEGELAAQGKQT